jgi:hypothetical protein
MKAEHRKELETNALADRVGRVMQGMKQKPQKRTMLWLVLAGVVIIVVWLFYRKSDVQRMENANSWAVFEDGRQKGLASLVARDPTSNAAKAAEFEIYYGELRNMLRYLATSPKEALKGLDSLDEIYGKLAEECKDDKVLLPEALFARAVIAETRIIKPEENWQAALDAYKVVADNHKDSALGKKAQKRVDILSNKDKRDEVLKVYQDLRIEFVHEDRLPPLPPLPQALDPGKAPVPPVLPVPKKEK